LVTVVDALERIGHALRTVLREAATREGLSVTQAELLLRLSRSGAAEPGALAAWLDVRPPTVTDSLAALRRKHLVERVADPADRRRHRLVLTESGEEVAGRLADWSEPVRHEVEASLGGSRQLLPDLLALIGRLQRAGHISIAHTCSTCRFYQPDRHPGSAAPDHCALMDKPLAPDTLRLDCPEHEPAA
jgi:DNA-binding MarR family transcriptional regulator